MSNNHHPCPITKRCRVFVGRFSPKPVIPFGGRVSLITFFERIGLARKVSELIPFTYTSNNALPPAQILVAFLVSVVAGARRFAHAAGLRADKALHALLGKRSRKPVLQSPNAGAACASTNR